MRAEKRVAIAATVLCAAGVAAWMWSGREALLAYAGGVGVTSLLLLILVPPQGPRNEVRR